MTLLEGEGLMKAEILKLTDSTSPDFLGFPTTNVQTAANWATVITSLFGEMSIPNTTTAVLGLCEPIFSSTFLAALSSGVPDTRGVVGFNNGLDAYTTELAVLLVSSGAAQVCLPPPPGTLNLELTMVGVTSDAVSAAGKFAQRVREWAQTGTAILVQPTVINWQ
jgi:hypothetical protein